MQLRDQVARIGVGREIPQCAATVAIIRRREIGYKYLRKHQCIRQIRSGGGVGIEPLHNRGYGSPAIAQRINWRCTAERGTDGNFKPGIEAGVVTNGKAFQAHASLAA